MQKKFLAITVLCLALFVGNAAAWAEGHNTLTTKAELKARGLIADQTRINSFSPDGRSFVTCRKNDNAEIAKGNVYTCYLLTLRNDNSINDIKAYPLNIPEWEQACFTPDGKDLVIITKSGASFLKLNFESGKITTIMEHKAGQAGFRAHPQVLQIAQGKMLALGYFYDNDSVAGPNCTAILDPNKTGVEAFEKVASIQKIQYQLKASNETFPLADCGFFFVYKDGACTLYNWRPDMKEPKVVDHGMVSPSFWGSDSRIAYTMQKGGNAYDLTVYDAATGTKTVLAETKKPYSNVFLSSDGSTAVFTDTNRVTRCKIYYAKASEGWKVTPIASIGDGIKFGVMRLSPDGKTLLLHNIYGYRFIDVK